MQTLIHPCNHCKHQQNKKKHKRHFFKNVENTAEHEESFCNSWSLKLVQYSVKRISAEICGEFYILHVANSHRRPPETVASRRVGGVNWILDDSRLSPTENLKSEHIRIIWKTNTPCCWAARREPELQHRLATEYCVTNRERKCADTIGTVLMVLWAGHFQC